MKRILYFIVLLIAGFGCEEDYNLNTQFSVPTELTPVDPVTIDVTSTNNVVLSWTGGGAEDGSLVIYQVLFDKEGGDFSNALDTLLSDMGINPTLTLTHATLNSIARKAGIQPEATGELIWTVLASKGGEVRPSNLTGTITITRGEGIDNFPEQLFLFGDVTENDGAGGLPFRKAANGVFVIYSKIPASGEIFFKSSTGGEGFSYYATETGKLKEGEGAYPVQANNNPYRITVNYNTLNVKTEVISDVRAIWGATFGVIGNLEYVMNGKFRADNARIVFVQQDRPETNPPSWLSWVEERYYFIAKVDGVDKCWGRKDGVSPERPVGGEPLSFYEIGEFTWSQWDHLWKMKGSLDMTTCTITLDTNIQGLMAHQFSNVTPIN
ncbi:MAG: SusE domain-containing protein [Mangrovibacterium sp.]